MSALSATTLSHATDGRRFGGKAKGLADALGHGFTIPDGVAYGVEAVDAIVQGAPEVIADLHARVDELGGAVAVRSSAIGEDSAAASFAGQHLTHLNATRRDARDAVRAVWESARTPAALAYRAKLGIDGEPSIAVVMQRLLRPIAAGVLFTRNPMNGENQFVIEASWGLGEAVVSGLVIPERLRLGLDGTVLEHDHGDKDVEMVALDNGGTEERAVAPDRARAPCLSAERIHDLFGLGTRITEAYSDSSDVEWAFEGDTLYLLQRRPLTR